MKIILTESQLKKITEQGVLDRIKAGAQNLYKGFEKSVESNPMLKNSVPNASPAGVSAQGILNMDPHVLLGLLEFGAEFIPEIGPAIAAGISAVDAAVYLKQGRKKEAGIALVLGCIPFAGQLINEIPGAKQLGSKGLSILADKIAKGITKLTPVENEVLNFINLNKPLIHKEMDGLFKRTAKTVASNKLATSLHPIVNKVAGAADAGVNYLKSNTISNTVKKGYETTYDALN